MQSFHVFVRSCAWSWGLENKSLYSRSVHSASASQGGLSKGTECGGLMRQDTKQAQETQHLPFSALASVWLG